jgi:hypothetical protein
MFNIKIKPEHNTGSSPYTESPQANPLRWMIMYREKDVLTSQAAVMRCKDYFNDLVALRQGHVFSIYGFKNDTVKFNKWGLYILLTGINKPDLFIDNVNKSINVRMKEDLSTSVRCWKQPDGSVVIRIPNKVWENTYAVSLVTMMLRVCNNNIELNSWDELYGDQSPLNTMERSFTAQAKKLTKKIGFKAPIDTWYYYNTQYNGVNGWTTSVGGLTVHNNGCSAWSFGIPADVTNSLLPTTEEVAA